MVKSLENVHTKSVGCVCVDESQIYSASEDKTIAVWKKSTYDLVGVLTGHTETITCLVVHEDLIYSGSYDDRIMVWDKIVRDLVITPIIKYSLGLEIN